MTTPRSTAPATPVLNISSRILRSPSHESVTTDLSLLSLSSFTSDALVGGTKHNRLVTFREGRGPSPLPDSSKLFVHINRPADIPEVMWFEEENDLILSCATLSKALGMQKSFSTSDISQLPAQDSVFHGMRPSVSELALNSIQRCGYMLNSRLEHTSRSCSTWVAVGELASASQLPSPHGGPSTNAGSLCTNTPPPPAFTAADLIRSVNKKVRQNYIRRRLLTTYRALERLSQSEFNLDRLEAVAAAAKKSHIIGPGPTELIVPTLPQQQKGGTSGESQKPTITLAEPKASASTTDPNELKQRLAAINMATKNLTYYDIERDRGKPLSKYERNMMIFNWLHSLDENAPVEDTP